MQLKRIGPRSHQRINFLIPISALTPLSDSKTNKNTKRNQIKQQQHGKHDIGHGENGVPAVSAQYPHTGSITKRQKIPNDQSAGEKRIEKVIYHVPLYCEDTKAQGEDHVKRELFGFL